MLSYVSESGKIMKQVILRGTLISTIALMPGLAGAFMASNLLQVNKVSNSVFEVVGNPGSGPGDYWCAAADFVQREVTNNATQRIYVTRALGQSETTIRRSAVQFSLTEPGAEQAGNMISLSVSHVGDSLIAASAREYCNDLKFLEP